MSVSTNYNIESFFNSKHVIRGENNENLPLLLVCEAVLLNSQAGFDQEAFLAVPTIQELYLYFA